ncbi:hypothetical protein MFMK1_002314 [Metallumcola ferriviriculae]|uniref:B box-type domain-containing protein n=1 Tax=Metallumcola ferriviriculae TaxID=3039180 RepID=A0AAU0UT91_9FIRM|nr:hypothetical protein MFMK1_002314 [Desulfitibacteraceae bacterium MK1]
MRIPVCDRCKTKDVSGVICRHCDTSYCYDCLDAHPPDMRLCPECEDFLCQECYQGMVKCDRKKKG